MILRAGQSLEQALEEICLVFVPCLAGIVPHCFPRQRWTGAEVTLRQLGLFEHCHGLLALTYLEWMAQWHHDDNEAVAAFRPDGAAALAALAAAPHVAQDVQDAAAEAAGVDPNRIRAEANRAFRRKTLSWFTLHGRSLASFLFAARLVLAPMQHYMASELKAHEHDAETRNDVSIGAMRNQQSLHEFFAANGNSYPVLRAALGMKDIECMDSIAALESMTDKFRLLPRQWMELSFNHLIFRLCTREAALVYKYLVHPHRWNTDFALFKVLTRPEYASELRRTRCEPSLSTYAEDRRCSVFVP